eukprot:m.462197 g.462197  ORF g.462197 m.462197 type:complete len:76 (+) comp21602_c1_seq7:231-458(+)
MISELIIAATLVINGFAVLNFKLTSTPSFDFDALEPAQPSMGDKFKEFLRNVRYFRIFIGVWNILLILMMLLIFS